MLHCFPAATLESQVFVWAKSPESVPVTVMPEMFSVTVPVFVNVMVCGELFVPTG